MLGYSVLHRDAAIPDHERRLQASTNPVVQNYLQLRRENRFYDFFARTPEQVATDFMIVIAEDFALTLEDLQAEPPQAPTILEGARLRADLIFNNFVPERRVAWLRPTELMFGQSIPSRPRIVELAQSLGRYGLSQFTKVFYLASELQVELARDFGVGVVAIEAPTDYPKIPEKVAHIWGVAL
jgi:hypothetical protein